MHMVGSNMPVPTASSPLADLPGFSSPAIWIAEVMAWSKMPFAIFPMRFSGWLVVKRGQVVKMVKWSRCWGFCQGITAVGKGSGNIIHPRHHLDHPWAGQAKWCDTHSDCQGEDLCLRRSFSQLLQCVHPLPKPCWGEREPLWEAVVIPQLVFKLEQGKDFYESCFLTKKNPKRTPRKNQTTARLHINQGNKAAYGQIIRSKSI